MPRYHRYTDRAGDVITSQTTEMKEPRRNMFAVVSKAAAPAAATNNGDNARVETKYVASISSCTAQDECAASLKLFVRLRQRQSTEQWSDVMLSDADSQLPASKPAIQLTFVPSCRRDYVGKLKSLV